jgi:hypothetical protein
VSSAGWGYEAAGSGWLGLLVTDTVLNSALALDCADPSQAVLQSQASALHHGQLLSSAASAGDRFAACLLLRILEQTRWRPLIG